MAAQFECYKDKAGEYRFRLKAGNGEIILSSEGYTSKQACMNGIESVQKNCAHPDRFEIKTTPTGKYRFSLKATNGQIIGVSQNYKTEAGCNKGMDSIGRSAPGATIEDKT